MQVRDGMSPTILQIGPNHTLRQAARLMTQRRVGAAVVLDADSHGPTILTERDILGSIAQGQDPDEERAGDHLTRDVVYASPDWSLQEAALAMLRGGFRHLIIMEGPELVGMLSMRDIVRVWAPQHADAVHV
jgi:CBS domain-containing protein